MPSTAVRKLSAHFFVLMMALAALVVMPGTSVVGQTPGTNDIYVPVVGPSYLPVPDAVVKLTNVHTGEVIQAHYSSGPFFVAEDAPSGYYRVDVTADEYYDSKGEVQFRFEGLASNTTAPIELDAFPVKSYTWNVTISPARQNAKVGFYNMENNEIVAYDLTNSVGRADMTMFDTTGEGTFYLFVQASGYETYLEPISVTGGNSSKTVTLTVSRQIIGFVNTGEGLAQNVVAYLLDTDPSVPWIARLLKSEPALGSFRFDAMSGHSYYLCVDAAGASANVSSIAAGASNLILDMDLAAQTVRTEAKTIAFGADYTTFDLNLTTTWSYDDAFPGLDYSDVGSLRMQIDLNGNADGTVDATEHADFRTMMMDYGPQDVSSNRLLVLNKTQTFSGRAYVSADALASFSLGSTEGSITLTTGVYYSYTCDYSVHTPSGEDPLPTDSPEYTIEFTARYDTAAADRVYTMGLIPDYELVQNSTIDSDVFVGGYMTVTVDPPTGSGYVVVGMTIEKTSRPSAGAGIDSSASSYADMLDKNVSRYVVKVGANVTFNGSSSSDPNGNPLTYTWDFGDGTTPVTTANETLVHIYAAASASRTVNLTITDVSGLQNWTTFNVTCDALDPVPVITVKNKTVNETDNSVAIDQREALTLNATDSRDPAVTAADALGNISWVQFDYGDGNSSGRVYWTDDQQNVTHTYERAGTFNLTLNVTDVVGHYKNTTLKVIVNDTTRPIATFTVKNATGGTSLVENATLIFNATATRDNLDNYTLLRYSWYFGDGNWTNGTGLLVVNHTYKKIGAVTVTLNVTDLSDNYHQYPKTITISQSPRPDMRITAVAYEPLSPWTEGDGGLIVVNMTNMGSANATNLRLTFYVISGDNEELLGSWTTILNGTQQVELVQVGGQVQAKFPWTFNNKGTYIIKVNVTSDNQLRPFSYTVSESKALQVDEAPWKTWVLWLGVLGVIVLVPLLIYLRGRLSKRERKGPRREKKEKGGEEEEL